MLASTAVAGFPCFFITPEPCIGIDIGPAIGAEDEAEEADEAGEADEAEKVGVEEKAEEYEAFFSFPKSASNRPFASSPLKASGARLQA